MTAASSKRLTFEEYVAIEEQSEERHEFYAGELFAMAGGTPEHAAVCAAVTHALVAQLVAPCRTFSEALRVRTPSGKVVYPDALVICGGVLRDPSDRNTVTNPTLVIEVLSESTEAYDRGKKFEHYRSCPSLVEYVLVASRGAPAIERFVKTNGVWTIDTPASSGQTLSLASAGVTLTIDSIYRGLVGEDGAILEL
ncbi:MAG: Uma2 family endonuclease [Labilithrix sp.]|nr:Uma2 family endonuclease [Labilithrix sp.]MCW5812852.1 Uma2 family endonuclease [Labilithrix sp.]